MNIQFRVPAEIGSTFMLFGQSNKVMRYEGLTEGGGVLVGEPVGECELYFSTSMNELMTGKPDDWFHLEALWGIKIIEMRYPRLDDEHIRMDLPNQFHLAYVWKDNQS